MSNPSLKNFSVTWSGETVVPEYANTTRLTLVENEPSDWNLKRFNINDSFEAFAKLQSGKGRLSARLSPLNASHADTLVVDDNLSISFHRTLFVLQSFLDGILLNISQTYARR